MPTTVVLDPNKVYSRIESLGYELEPNDYDRVGYLMDLIAEKIKLNTHASGIPADLENTAVDMIVGEFLATKLAVGKLDSSIIENVAKRITEGDTTIEYAVGEGNSTPEQRFKNYIDKLRTPPDWVFASVRRIRW